MTRRRKPSSIDRLDPQVQELIGSLRRSGRTIDEILDKLRELDVDVSRSALGRHVKGLAEISEQMRTSRAIAEALVGQFAEQSDDKIARANIELAHGMVMRALTAGETDPETGAFVPAVFDAEESMFLARALQSLTSAAKTSDDRITKAIERATRDAAKKAGDAARTKGLGAETVDFIRKAVLGSEAA